MDKLKVAITAGGAPQAATLIRWLKNHGEAEVQVAALDMNPEVAGRFLADSFHRIPAAGAPGYRERILEIVRAERPQAFVNACGADVLHIARMAPEIEALGCKVLASDPAAIEMADNKHTLYTILKDTPGVQVPGFLAPASLDEFVRMARDLGYPGRDICFKPHVSKGSRGFRILSERFDRRDLLLNHKPTARYMTLAEFAEIFRDAPEFPRLLLMEMAEGEECDVMTLAYGGEALLTTVKSRESHRWGVIDRGELIHRPELVRATARIIERIPLAYNISIQFIGGKVIEINPRTSTFIYGRDFSEPWLAVKLALGLITPDQVRACQERIPLGRRMVRYMDQLFFDPDGTWFQ